MFEIKSILEDKSRSAKSILTEIEINEFYEFLTRKKLLSKKIEGQRNLLNTKKSRKIAERLKSDIENNAILPPIVLGVISDKTDTTQILDLLGTEDIQLFILDGVQRCSYIVQVKEDIIKEDKTGTQFAQKLRVEIWVTKDLNTALDRMLVMNFAQLPWDIKQQAKAFFNMLSHVTKEFKTLEQEFEEELQKYPNRFLECVFAYLEGDHTILIADSIDSNFIDPKYKAQLQEANLQHFSTVYKNGRSFAKKISIQMHPCLLTLCAYCGKNLKNKVYTIEQMEILFAWLDDISVEALGIGTLKEKFNELKYNIGPKVRDIYNLAFENLFDKIIRGELSTTDYSIVIDIIDDIWENSYNQIMDQSGK